MSYPEIMSQRIIDCLRARPGVRALAIIGSRAGADPSLIDRYSDLDLFVCCDDEERAAIIDASWADAIEPPVLVFPRVMDDEVRILFDHLFDCEVHMISPERARELTGPCTLGNYAVSGFTIVHDPEAIFAELRSRIEREPQEERNMERTSSVFWYNLAFCANLIMRGDLYRVTMFAHFYMQIWLLELLFNMDGDGTEKWIHRKLTPDQYEMFAATIRELTPEGMREGLRAMMRCYWYFQKLGAPDINPESLERYRRIETEVLRRLEEEEGNPK